MKRIISLALTAITGVTVCAQETYENALLLQEDLNGTARYVGMGGAMDALGADLSTIGTNPAGIGLFRSSQAKVSFGGTTQEGAEEFANAKKTRVSFDQAGFVYSTRTGESSFLNFAFNYKKSRNFGQILSAANKLNGASQNKQSYIKGAMGVFDLEVSNDGLIDSRDNSFTQLDYLYYNTLLSGYDADDNLVYGYNDASAYLFNQYNKGYIGEYDFNISGNIKDRVYLGLTVGIHSVNYKGYSEYAENLIDVDGNSIGDVGLIDEREITGTGFNVKAGVIIRPVEYSPFRIGLSVATPTWYDLSSTNYNRIVNNTSEGLNTDGRVEYSHDFKLYTPWKFGLCVGTTVSNYLALGAGIEYADYSATDPRINEGSSYDWYNDTYYEHSSTDHEMKRHTEQVLQGVYTVKAGLELKPDDNFAIRLGYNYVSPMYQDNAQRSVENYSPAMYYTSSTAFTNWKATNRITCGVGYTVDKFTIDAAYQYSTQKGDFYPFSNIVGSSDDLTNTCGAVSVEDNRHQLLLTLGYAF